MDEQNTPKPQEPTIIGGERLRLERAGLTKGGERQMSRLLTEKDADELTARLERMKNAPPPPEYLENQAHYQRMVEICTPEAPSCGWEANGAMTGLLKPKHGNRPVPCEGKTMFCPHGRFEYIRKVQGYLSELGFAEGDYHQACFMLDSFIRDDLSKIYYDYALGEHAKDGALLLVTGSNGPGKSFGAIAALAHIKVTGQASSCLYLNAAATLLAMKTDVKLIDQARKVRFLLLDDLGAELDVPENKVFLYSILDARIATGLPTIITSNLGKKEFKVRYEDQRLLDRLRTFDLKETSLPSKRKKKAAEKRIGEGW